MPVYEYQCKACGQEFEYQQRMSDPDKTTCEACGGGLERLISRTAFQLKGSGWYKDLYSSNKPASSEGKSDSGASSGSADKGAADKPAASTGSSSGAASDGSSSSGSAGSGSREAAGSAA
jgi:putative FmdB family regulatory protein